jgi:NitT/TauT family transport system permease protein
MGGAIADRRAALGSPSGTVLQIAGIVGFGVVMLACWHSLVAFDLVSEKIVPSPADTGSELARAVGELFTGGPILDAALYTLQEVIAGFAIAAIAGIVLGVVAGDTRFGRRILMPYLVAINAAPKVAFAPIFVAWLGFGMGPKILMAVVIAFFPVVINTALGVQSATLNQLLLFQSARASRLQVLWYLKLPTALPAIFASLRLAVVLSVVGAVVGEFLGGNAQGLGEQIRVAHQRIEVDLMFALIILLSALSIALYCLMAVIERRAVSWNATARPGA